MIKIIVKTEEEKQNLLNQSEYIHDFLINKDNTAYAFATVNIKGNEKDFKIPLSYNLQGTNKAIAKGAFAFKRTDFEIGTGLWSSTLVLKDEVTINVILSLDLVK